MRATAMLAALVTISSSLVFAASAPAQAAPNIVTSNLQLNLDGNSTSSLPAGATNGSSWTSVSPASWSAAGNIWCTSCSRYSSGGIGGMTFGNGATE